MMKRIVACMALSGLCLMVEGFPNNIRDAYNFGDFGAGSALKNAQSVAARARAYIDGFSHAALRTKQDETFAKSNDTKAQRSFEDKHYLNKDSQDNVHHGSNTDLAFINDDTFSKDNKDSYHRGDFTFGDNTLKWGSAYNNGHHDDTSIDTQNESNQKSENALDADLKNDESARNNKAGENYSGLMGENDISIKIGGDSPKNRGPDNPGRGDSTGRKSGIRGKDRYSWHGKLDASKTNDLGIPRQHNLKPGTAKDNYLPPMVVGKGNDLIRDSNDNKMGNPVNSNTANTATWRNRDGAVDSATDGTMDGNGSDDNGDGGSGIAGNDLAQL